MYAISEEFGDPMHLEPDYFIWRALLVDVNSHVLQYVRASYQININGVVNGDGAPTFELRID
jgi:hypothetical protein